MIKVSCVQYFKIKCHKHKVGEIKRAHFSWRQFFRGEYSGDKNTLVSVTGAKEEPIILFDEAMASYMYQRFLEI